MASIGQQAVSPKPPEPQGPSKWNYVAIALVILGVILFIALMLSKRLQSAFPYNMLVVGIIIILFIYGMGFFYHISEKFYMLYSLLITLTVAIIILLITFNLKTMQLGGFILFITLACVFALAAIILLSLRNHNRILGILGGVCLCISMFFIMFITGCELRFYFNRSYPTSTLMLEMFLYFFEMAALFLSIYLCFTESKPSKTRSSPNNSGP